MNSECELMVIIPSVVDYIISESLMFWSSKKMIGQKGLEINLEWT